MEKNFNYGSIERKSIISFFKNNALKNNTIKIINSNITHIISNNNYNELIEEQIIEQIIESSYSDPCFLYTIFSDNEFFLRICELNQ